MSLDVLPQCHLSEEGLGTVFAFVAPLDCLHFALESATLPGLDVVISQLVVGEQGLHGVRGTADFTGKHRIVQICLPFAFGGRAEQQLHLTDSYFTIRWQHSSAVLGNWFGDRWRGHVVTFSTLGTEFLDLEGRSGVGTDAGTAFVAMRCDMTLQLDVCGKGLRAEDATVRLALFVEMFLFDVEVQVVLSLEVPFARRTVERGSLVTVFGGQVNLNRRLRVEHLLAEGTSVKHDGVHLK